MLDPRTRAALSQAPIMGPILAVKAKRVPCIIDDDVCGVGWASRPPCCASRVASGGVEPRSFPSARAGRAFGWFKQDARTGGRDAHPTHRLPPLRELRRRGIRRNQTLGYYICGPSAFHSRSRDLWVMLRPSRPPEPRSGSLGGIAFYGRRFASQGVGTAPLLGRCRELHHAAVTPRR